MPATSRNALCRCRSGLRYKHCCGSQRDLGLRHSSPSENQRLTGLEWHRHGRFVEAIKLYDAVLEKNPADWDVAHMRAVAFFQLGLFPESRAAFATLLSTPAAELPGFWTNLGLLIAAVCADPLSGKNQGRLNGHSRFRRPPATQTLDTCPLPTVSVVMPAYNHAAYVGQAIDSVFAQSRRPLELIVIDDGSTDSTAEACRRALASAPIPVTFISRENRGAPATLNQAIDLAKGEFIQPINSDDLLPAKRVESMLSALLVLGGEWGFARVACVNPEGERLHVGQHTHALSLARAQDSVMMSRTVSLNLLRANAAISSGNLTFRKTLWRTLSGFRDYRYNHDWDFCLRAALEGEPILVPDQLYTYRIHASNTISESPSAPRLEHKRMMADFIAYSQRQTFWPNPLAPTLVNWGNDYLALLGATDSLRHVPIALIEQVLGEAATRVC